MSILTRAPRPALMEKQATRFMLTSAPGGEIPELISLLLQQHSFLSEFSISTQVHGSDAQAGYFYGVFIVRAQMPPDMPVSKDTQNVRVPFMVQSKKVYPFDVFITKEGSFFPLTQARVTTTLLKPTPYTPVSSAQALGAQNARSSFMPDTSATGDSELGRYTSSKLGSAILGDVLCTVPHEERDAFLQAYVSSDLVKWAARHSALIPATLEKVANVPYNAVVDVTPAKSFDVAVLKYDSKGFTVKAAQLNKPFATVELPLSRAEAEDFAVDLRCAAMERGYVALATGGKEKIASPAFTDNLHKPAVADKHGGLYSIRSDDGTYCEAAVFTKIAQLSGRATDRVLVIGDGGMSLQEAPAGLFTGVVLPVVGNPLHKLASKNVLIIGDTVTEPLKYLGTDVKSDGDELRVETDIGARYTLKLAHVQTIVPAGKNTFLIPNETTCWPYDQAKRGYTTDASFVSNVVKVAELDSTATIAYEAPGAVVTWPDGDIVKLASDSDVLLWLLSVGDTAEGATEKLAGMCGSPGKKVKILAKKPVKEATIVKESGCGKCKKGKPCVVHAKLARDDVVKTAAEICIDLSKEAALVAAPDTLDAVLSLGFVNEQNIAMFLEHLPTLEKAVSSLAEMLLGVRLGIQDIPEPSVASALSGVERSIQGLKKLNIRLSLSGATGA